MSKLTAQCLFLEQAELQKRLVDVNKKLKKELRRYYTSRGCLPSMEQFKKEIRA